MGHGHGAEQGERRVAVLADSILTGLVEATMMAFITE
jgi:hypothetical protein